MTKIVCKYGIFLPNGDLDTDPEPMIYDSRDEAISAMANFDYPEGTHVEPLYWGEPEHIDAAEPDTVYEYDRFAVSVNGGSIHVVFGYLTPKQALEVIDQLYQYIDVASETRGQEE